MSLAHVFHGVGATMSLAHVFHGVGATMLHNPFSHCLHVQFLPFVFRFQLVEALVDFPVAHTCFNRLDLPQYGPSGEQEVPCISHSICCGFAICVSAIRCTNMHFEAEYHVLSWHQSLDDSLCLLTSSPSCTHARPPCQHAPPPLGSSRGISACCWRLKPLDSPPHEWLLHINAISSRQ